MLPLLKIMAKNEAEEEYEQVVQELNEAKKRYKLTSNIITKLSWMKNELIQ